MLKLNFDSLDVTSFDTGTQDAASIAVTVPVTVGDSPLCGPTYWETCEQTG
jgi:hypothetical protein